MWDMIKGCEMANGAEPYWEIADEDLYPPGDDRLHSPGVDDVPNGDSFDEYARWFWGEYGREIYD